jgi:hypothetical protein
MWTLKRLTALCMIAAIFSKLKECNAVSYHLVTTLLLHKENSWKAEAEDSNWLASPKLAGISKTVYSSDEYIPYFKQFQWWRRLSSSIFTPNPDFAPWMALFSSMDLKKHDIEVLPIVNPKLGQECPGVLTFIIDNYDDLPDVTFFLHGYPFNHNPDILEHIEAMKSWSPDFVGFTHLNNQVRISLSKSYKGDRLEPWGVLYQCRALVEKLYLNVDTSVNDDKPLFSTQCCGQFAVSRANILQAPKEFYVLARKMAYESGCCYCFEYIWHFMFGLPAIMPENATSTVKGRFPEFEGHDERVRAYKERDRQKKLEREQTKAQEGKKAAPVHSKKKKSGGH